MKLNNLVIIGVAGYNKEVASCAPQKRIRVVRTLSGPYGQSGRNGICSGCYAIYALVAYGGWSASDAVWCGRADMRTKRLPCRPPKTVRGRLRWSRLKGKFYTFNVKINGKWLGDTPGINAQAVGVNGKRAAVIDMGNRPGRLGGR